MKKLIITLLVLGFISAPFTQAQTISAEEKAALIVEIQAKLVVLMDQLQKALQEQINQANTKIANLEAKQSVQATSTLEVDEDVRVGAPVEVVKEPRGKLQISGSDNAIQIALIGHDPNSPVFQVTPPETMKEVLPRETCSVWDGVKSCSTHKSFILKENTDTKNVPDLPSGTEYNFTIKVFDKEYTYSVKKGQAITVFDHK